MLSQQVAPAAGLAGVWGKLGQCWTRSVFDVDDGNRNPGEGVVIIGEAEFEVTELLAIAFEVNSAVYLVGCEHVLVHFFTSARGHLRAPRSDLARDVRERPARLA